MNQNAKRRHQAGLRGLEEHDPIPLDQPREEMSALEPGRHTFEVPPDAKGERIDRFLVRVAGLSRTRIQALIQTGVVSVDEAIAADAGLRLAPAQSIRLDLPAPASLKPAGEAIPLVVLFEDEHLIVVDKPAGLVVHPAAGHEQGTLVNALIAHCGDSLSGIGGVRRPGIVHRLDKDTSGLLVVAKTDAAHQGLAALFADHGRTLSLMREYVAFVWDVPERRNGIIDAPLGRHRFNREKQAVVPAARGREAITHYATERIFLRSSKPVAARVRCRLETGRTHQIRVHMAHIGHPLIGDALYGQGYRTKAGRLEPEARALVEALGRQALHAATLGFAHPITGEDMMFESALPADLAMLEPALD